MTTKLWIASLQSIVVLVPEQGSLQAEVLSPTQTEIRLFQFPILLFVHPGLWSSHRGIGAWSVEYCKLQMSSESKEIQPWCSFFSELFVPKCVSC